MEMICKYHEHCCGSQCINGMIFGVLYFVGHWIFVSIYQLLNQFVRLDLGVGESLLDDLVIVILIISESFVDCCGSFVQFGSGVPSQKFALCNTDNLYHTALQVRAIAMAVAVIYALLGGNSDVFIFYRTSERGF